MRRAVARLLCEAERHYASADLGLGALPWRAALSVRSARLIYAAIGERLEIQGHDVLGGRAVVSGRAKARLLVLAGFAALGDIPSRLGRAGAGQPHIPVREVRSLCDVLPVGGAVRRPSW